MKPSKAAKRLATRLSRMVRLVISGVTRYPWTGRYKAVSGYKPNPPVDF